MSRLDDIIPRRALLELYDMVHEEVNTRRLQKKDGGYTDWLFT